MTMRSKFGAQKTEVDGHWFDSKGEARRYQELKLRWLAKEIFDLELQPVYPIELNGVKVCDVIPDFRYLENGKVVIEDLKSKGTFTPLSRLKYKLLCAMYGDLDARIIYADGSLHKKAKSGKS